MKRKILSLVLALSMVVSLFEGMILPVSVADAADEDTYIPLEVSGFNKDVVVENTATLSGSLWDYAKPFDGDNEGARMALYENRGGSSTYGLPSSRDIGNGKFTLQPYDQNNVLQLYGEKTDSTAKGSLQFAIQTGYPEIAFLGAGGNGEAPFEALITYTDGTQSTTLTSAAPDWYVGEYDGFYQGPFGRVKLDNSTTEGGNGPNLYAFTIKTNQFKAVESIDFVYTGGGNMRLNIMAVSGVIPANTSIITFNANGGIGSMVTVTGVAGNYELPECGFAPRAGYIFEGWSTSVDGTVYQPGTEFSITEDTTLYARWLVPAGLPVITSHPKDVSISPSATWCNLPLTVVAAGEGLTYQWEFKKDGTSEFTAISGATQSTYTTSNNPASVKGEYRCVVSNSVGSVTSDAAKMSGRHFTYGVSSHGTTIAVYPYGYTDFHADVSNITDHDDAREIVSTTYEWYESSSNYDILGTVLGTEAAYQAPANLAVGEHYFCLKITVAWSDGTTETGMELYGPFNVAEKTPITSLDGIKVNWAKMDEFDFSGEFSADYLTVTAPVAVNDVCWCVKVTDAMRTAIINFFVEMGAGTAEEAAAGVDQMLARTNGWLNNQTFAQFGLELLDSDELALFMELEADDGYFFQDMENGTEYDTTRSRGEFYLPQGTVAEVKAKVEFAPADFGNIQWLDELVNYDEDAGKVTFNIEYDEYNTNQSKDGYIYFAIGMPASYMTEASIAALKGFESESTPVLDAAALDPADLEANRMHANAQTLYMTNNEMTSFTPEMDLSELTEDYVLVLYKFSPENMQHLTYGEYVNGKDDTNLYFPEALEGDYTSDAYLYPVHGVYVIELEATTQPTPPPSSEPDEDDLLKLGYYGDYRFPDVIVDTAANTITLPAISLSQSQGWITVTNLTTNRYSYANCYWCYFSESDNMWITLDDDYEYESTVIDADCKYGIMVRANATVDLNTFAGIRPENVFVNSTLRRVEKVYLEDYSDSGNIYPSIILVPIDAPEGDYEDELSADLAVTLNYEELFGRLIEDEGDSIGTPDYDSYITYRNGLLVTSAFRIDYDSKYNASTGEWDKIDGNERIDLTARYRVKVHVYDGHPLNDYANIQGIEDVYFQNDNIKLVSVTNGSTYDDVYQYTKYYLELIFEADPTILVRADENNATLFEGTGGTNKFTIYPRDFDAQISGELNQSGTTSQYGYTIWWKDGNGNWTTTLPEGITFALEAQAQSLDYTNYPAGLVANIDSTVLTGNYAFRVSAESPTEGTVYSDTFNVFVDKINLDPDAQAWWGFSTDENGDPVYIKSGTLAQALSVASDNWDTSTYILLMQDITVTDNSKPFVLNGGDYTVLDMNQKTITVIHGSNTVYGIYSNSAEIFVKNGTIIVESTAYAYGIYGYDYPYLEVDNCKIIATSTDKSAYGIRIPYYAEVSNCDITATSGDTAYGFYIREGYWVSITDCSIDATSTANEAYGIYTNAETEITGCEIYAKTASKAAYGINAYDTYSNDVFVKDCTIEAESSGGNSYGILNRLDTYVSGCEINATSVGDAAMRVAGIYVLNGATVYLSGESSITGEVADVMIGDGKIYANDEEDTPTYYNGSYIKVGYNPEGTTPGAGTIVVYGVDDASAGKFGLNADLAADYHLERVENDLVLTEGALTVIEDLSDWVTFDKSDGALDIKFPTPEEGYEVYGFVKDMVNGDVEGYLALLGQPVAASAGAFTEYNSALIPSGWEPLYVNESNETQYSSFGRMNIGDVYLIVLVNTAVTDTNPNTGNPRYAIVGLAAGYYGASKIEDLSSWVEYDEETHTFTITPPQITPYEYASFEYMIQEYRHIEEDSIAESWNSVKGLDTLMEITEEDLSTRRTYHTSVSWTEDEPVTGKLWEGQTLVIFTYNPEINYNGYYAITGAHAIAFSTDEYIRDMKPELTPDNGVYNITPAEGTLFYVVNGSGTSGTGYEYNQSTGFPVISTERMEAADAEYELDSLMDRYYEYTGDYYYSGMPNPFNLGGTIQYAPGDFDVMVIRALEARGYPTTPEYIAAYKESFAPLYLLEMKNDPYVKAGYDSWDGDFNYYPLTGIFEDYMKETLENTRDKILSLEGKLVQNPDDIFDVTFYPEVGKTYIVVTSTANQNVTNAQLAMNSPVGMTVLDEINANQIAFSMTMGRVYSMPYKYAVMPAATSSYATYQLIVGDAENSVNGVAIEFEGNRQIAAYEVDTDGKYTVDERIVINEMIGISAGDYYPIVAYHAVAAVKPVIEITDYRSSVEVEQGNIDEELILFLWTRTPTANYQWFRCDADGNVIEEVPAENIIGEAYSSESVSAVLLALDLADSDAGTYYYICKITAEGADPVTSEVMTVTVVATEPGEHEHEYTYTSNNDGTHNGACECGEDAIENEPCTYVDGKCEKCGYEETETPPEHEHEYTYTSNNDGTHNGACECGKDAITNEACEYEDGICVKCGYEAPVVPEDPTCSVIVTVKEDTSNNVYIVCDDAIVTLIGLNGEEYVQRNSIGNGVYVFENVSNGIYNLVIQRGEKIKTVLVTVDGKSVDLGVVYLPFMQIKSEVNVDVDIEDDSPIKGALVGGLDKLAETIAEEIEMEDGVSVSVEVAMKINAQMSDDVDAEHKSSIEEEARSQSENLTFLDITIDKTITTKKTGEDAVETKDAIHDTVSLLEILIPFDTDGRYDFAVYRYHEDHHTGNNVQKLTSTPNSDNEYITVEDGVIKMYVRYFSTYAIGYSDGTESTEYTVSFNANGGTGTMAAVTAPENTMYTLPACGFTAPEGKEFKAWEINGIEYAVGDKIPVTKNITVKAVWKDIPVPPVTPNIPTNPVNPSYRVDVEDVYGGTIRVTPKTATAGTTVTVIVTPDEGYELVELIITNAAGDAVKWTSAGNDRYTFVMPNGKVDVSAVFAKIKENCPKDSTCPIWPFKDAETTAWYHDGVHYCIENGLMNGLPGNLFDPNGTTTRAQIVTILWRLEGEPYANYAMSFTDVAAGQWYTEAVRWAAANGIVTGHSDTVFAPNDAITREQMTAILWRYCQYKGIDVSVRENTNILSYSDAFDVHSWAIPAMQWACGAGVINGIADGNSMKLDPTGSATRAQVATMLWRFCMEIMEP